MEKLEALLFSPKLQNISIFFGAITFMLIIVGFFWTDQWFRFVISGIALITAISLTVSFPKLQYTVGFGLIAIVNFFFAVLPQ